MSNVSRTNLEVRREIKKGLGEDLSYCFQCGGCTSVCPWGETNKKFNPRQIVRKAQLGVGNLLSDDIWLCTTCNECVDHCPHDVDMPYVMSSVRSLSLEEAEIPTKLQEALESMFRLGNPWEGSVKKRTEWIGDLKVEEYKDQNTLFWIGCTPAYENRNQEVAKNLIKILNHMRADYGIIGNKEKCCGNSALRLGEEGLFQELKKDNLKNIKRAGAYKIVTISPHCFNTFKNEYEDIDAEIVHYTQYLNDLLDESDFSNDFNQTVVYKDPCYLGRKNDIYEEPRELLEKVPGLDLVEMKNSRERAICCGGGGGRIWAETDPEDRFSNLGLEEAMDTKARILATACPFCTINFEDSVKTQDVEDKIKIMDVAEIIWSAVQ